MTQKTVGAETISKPKMTSKEKTVRLAKMGMLVAIAIVLVYFIHFPIIPALPFLEYDPADISILMGTFAFGPVAGLALTVVTSVVQGLTVSSMSGLYGIIMHIIATSTLSVSAGIIYKKNKTKKGAVIALVVGTLLMVAIMFPANLIVTPIFMGVERSILMGMMPLILLFNFLKAGINSIVTFLLYKRISGFLHR